MIETILRQNLPQNFPTIDRFENGIATSIKSMNLADATYQIPANITNSGRGYIDTVARFQGGQTGTTRITGLMIRQRALDLAVPLVGTAAQRRALRGLVDYGRERGVIVTIVEIE
ncbi:MAG: hypothetical protein HYX68_06985 [Planctomycetes bacterium]|nr:hypothetical protein [Planctomycetota bacterium]